MIIQCPNCRTRYHYDEKRFAGAPAKKIRCTKCPSVFEIQNPDASAPPQSDFHPDETGPSSSPLLRSDDFSLDTTMMGGGPRKRAVTSIPVPPGVALRPPQPPPIPPVSLPASLTSVQSPAPVAPPATATGPHAALGARMGTEGRRLKLPERERLSLACIAGPDAGKIFEIVKPRTVIGRANADVVLSDGECSRQHAAIEVSDDLAMLIDLASTNGTYVGERRIKEYELENRSEFDVGTSTLMFIRSRRD